MKISPAGNGLNLTFFTHCFVLEPSKGVGIRLFYLFKVWGTLSLSPPLLPQEVWLPGSGDQHLNQPVVPPLTFIQPRELFLLSLEFYPPTYRLCLFPKRDDFVTFIFINSNWISFISIIDSQVLNTNPRPYFTVSGANNLWIADNTNSKQQMIIGHLFHRRVVLAFTNRGYGFHMLYLVPAFDWNKYGYRIALGSL